MSNRCSFYFTNVKDLIADREAKRVIYEDSSDVRYGYYVDYGDIFLFMLGYVRNHMHENKKELMHMMQEYGMFTLGVNPQACEKLDAIYDKFSEDKLACQALEREVRKGILENVNYMNTLYEQMKVKGTRELSANGFIGDKKERYIILDNPSQKAKQMRWYHVADIASLDDIIRSVKIMSCCQNEDEYQLTVGRDDENTPWLTGVVTYTSGKTTESALYRFIPVKWVKQALQDEYNSKCFAKLHINVEAVMGK